MFESFFFSGGVLFLFTDTAVGSRMEIQNRTKDGKFFFSFSLSIFVYFAAAKGWLTPASNELCNRSYVRNGEKDFGIVVSSCQI